MRRHNPFVTNMVLLVVGICLLASPGAPAGALMIAVAMGRQGLWGYSVSGEKAKRDRRDERRQIDHEVKLWKSIR